MAKGKTADRALVPRDDPDPTPRELNIGGAGPGRITGRGRRRDAHPAAPAVGRLAHRLADPAVVGAGAPRGAHRRGLDVSRQEQPDPRRHAALPRRGRTQPGCDVDGEPGPGQVQLLGGVRPRPVLGLPRVRRGLRRRHRPLQVRLAGPVPPVAAVARRRRARRPGQPPLPPRRRRRGHHHRRPAHPVSGADHRHARHRPARRRLLPPRPGLPAATLRLQPDGGRRRPDHRPRPPVRAHRRAVGDVAVPVGQRPHLGDGPPRRPVRRRRLPPTDARRRAIWP